MTDTDGVILVYRKYLRRNNVRTSINDVARFRLLHAFGKFRE